MTTLTPFSTPDVREAAQRVMDNLTEDDFPVRRRLVPWSATDRPLEEFSREAARSRRKRPVRARTISIVRMSQRERQAGLDLHGDLPRALPATRAECENAPRPCPFVSCKHHLFLDVSPTTGAIKLNFPDLEAWELGESCSLDIAERGAHTLEQVGEVMNMTREGMRLLERDVLKKLRASPYARENYAEHS